MKKSYFVLIILFCIVIPTVNAHADLNIFLSNLNINAKDNMDGYAVKLSSQFNIPLPQVQVILKTVAFPADGFMCFQLSLMTGIKLERVVEIYHNNKSKGWGAIAKELGIKPGSPEFHRIKSGDFAFNNEWKKDTNTKQTKGKSRTKGHKAR